LRRGGLSSLISSIWIEVFREEGRPIERNEKLMSELRVGSEIKQSSGFQAIIERTKGKAKELIQDALER